LTDCGRNNVARFGGNGGISLRKVSQILKVPRFQTGLDDSFQEDSWLSSRMGLLPDAHMCEPALEREFVVEDIWQERPLGYHINPAGWSDHVWQDPGKRKMIFDYCPEVKIILDMHLERERCQVPISPAASSDGNLNPEFVVPEPAVVIDESGGVSGSVEDGIAKIDFEGNVAVNA
jgi:hypothetical protein